LEISIDLFEVGYFIGRYGTRIAIYFMKAKIVIAGYKKVSNVAANHKIDNTDPSTVTENIFECLQYID
jgi:hypothetical protein